MKRGCFSTGYQTFLQRLYINFFHEKHEIENFSVGVLFSQSWNVDITIRFSNSICHVCVFVFLNVDFVKVICFPYAGSWMLFSILQVLFLMSMWVIRYTHCCDCKFRVSVKCFVHFLSFVDLRKLGSVHRSVYICSPFFASINWILVQIGTWYTTKWIMFIVSFCIHAANAGRLVLFGTSYCMVQCFCSFVLTMCVCDFVPLFFWVKMFQHNQLLFGLASISTNHNM